MVDFTDIETEFRINVSAPDFDIVRGLEVAMQVEERGRRFYSELARTGSAPLRPFMKFLADQEREHTAALEGLKATLKTAKLWMRLPASQVQEPLKDFSGFKKHPGNEHMDKPSEIHSIFMAMQMEKKSREFYLRLADAVKNQEGRSFFVSLANWEKAHYELLSGIYNAESYTRLET